MVTPAFHTVPPDKPRTFPVMICCVQCFLRKQKSKSSAPSETIISSLWISQHKGTAATFPKHRLSMTPSFWISQKLILNYLSNPTSIFHTLLQYNDKCFDSRFITASQHTFFSYKTQISGSLQYLSSSLQFPVSQLL